MYVRIDPVEREAIGAALLFVGSPSSLPDWYDDLRRLWERAARAAESHGQDDALVMPPTRVGEPVTGKAGKPVYSQGITLESSDQKDCLSGWHNVNHSVGSTCPGCGESWVKSSDQQDSDG